MSHTNLFFNNSNGMLLDVNNGIFKYNVDTQTMELVTALRNRERKVLLCLLDNENKLVSREYLLAQAWPGRIVSDNTISVAMHNLRKVLMHIDTKAYSLITVRNAGFIFSSERAGLKPVASLDMLLESLR